MAGRPFGADDSSPVREPGNTSLLSTMLKPGLSGMPMRPASNHPGMNAPRMLIELLQKHPQLMQGLLKGHFKIEDLMPLLMQMRAVQGAGSPF